jgi:hypothetical protein
MPHRLGSEFREALEAAKQADLNLDLMRELIRSTPGLYWAKWRRGYRDYVMFAVSRDYTEHYLGTRDTSLYEGKSDREIWPAETARIFADNDEAAYEHGREQLERVDLINPYTKRPEIFDGIKWVSRTGNVTLLGGKGEWHHV